MADMATATRPGRDPSQPFSDLFLAEESGQSSSVTINAAAPAPSSSTSYHLPPIHVQIASLHRAAEVARHEWRARERQRAAARNSSQVRPAATAYRPSSQPAATTGDVGYQRIPVWIEERRDSASQRRDRRTPSPSRSSQQDSPEVGRSAGAGILDISSGSSDSGSSSTSSDSEATENALLPTHRNRSTTSFESSSQIWDRLLHDLAVGAGIEMTNSASGSDGVTSGGTGSMATLLSLSSTQFRSRNAPSSSAPRLPHPIWARRYAGPAGDWLRAELARRYTSFLSSQADNRPQLSAASRADLELYRTQRSREVSGSSAALRRRPTATPAAAPNDSSNTDTLTSPGRPNRLVFPALDPSDRSGQQQQQVPALPRGSPEASPEPPARAVRATPSTAMTLYPRAGVETRISRSSRVGGDPGRSSGTIRNGSATADDAVVQQNQAASDVARLAAQARERARRAQEARRSAASSTQTQPQPSATGGNSSRATQGGLEFLRRLRRLDGLEDENGQRVSPPQPARAPSPPPRRYDVFPWYQAPRRRAQSLIRQEPRTRPRSDGFDPDGEMAGWYTAARARMEEYQRRARHEQGLISDGEHDEEGGGMLDPDGERERRAPPPPPPRLQVPPVAADASQARPRQTASASQRHRNRSALVMAVDAPDDEQGGVQGWTLIDAHVADSPMEELPRATSPDLLSPPAATTWLNPHRRFSTSPSPMEGPPTGGAQPRASPNLSTALNGRRQELTGSRTEPTDLRSLRRPQRLPSVSNADVESLHSSRGSRSPSESPVEGVLQQPPPPPAPPAAPVSANPPQPIPVFASSARRASFLTGRPTRVTGDSPVQPPPQPVARSSRSSQERRLAASLSSASELASQLTAEIRSRHSELLTRERHLRAQLARRREELDQLRRREGRIGRVLDPTSTDTLPSEAQANADATDEVAAQEQQGTLSVRRSLRDVAPRRAMIGRVVEAAAPALAGARRQVSTAEADDDVVDEGQKSNPTAEGQGTPSETAAHADTASPSEIPSPGSPSSHSSTSSHEAPSLATPEDVEELGEDAVALLAHVDTLGMPRYQEAARCVVRELADSRIHSAVPSACGSEEGEGGMPLELEPVSPDVSTAPATTPSVSASETLQMRVVAVGSNARAGGSINAPSSTTQTSTTTSVPPSSHPPLPSRHEQAWALASLEDADWSTARARVLARASATANQGESHIDMRRRALGLPPRGAAAGAGAGAGGRDEALSSRNDEGSEASSSMLRSHDGLASLHQLSGPRRSEVLLRYLSRFGSNLSSLQDAMAAASTSGADGGEAERSVDAIGESPSRSDVREDGQRSAESTAVVMANQTETAERQESLRIADAARIERLSLTSEQRQMLRLLLARQGGSRDVHDADKDDGGVDANTPDEEARVSPPPSTILDRLIDSRSDSFREATKSRLRSMGALRSQAPCIWLRTLSFRLGISAPHVSGLGAVQGRTGGKLIIALFTSVDRIEDEELRQFDATMRSRGEGGEMQSLARLVGRLQDERGAQAQRGETRVINLVEANGHGRGASPQDEAQERQDLGDPDAIPRRRGSTSPLVVDREGSRGSRGDEASAGQVKLRPHALVHLDLTSMLDSPSSSSSGTTGTNAVGAHCTQRLNIQLDLSVAPPLTRFIALRVFNSEEEEGEKETQGSDQPCTIRIQDVSAFGETARRSSGVVEMR